MSEILNTQEKKLRAIVNHTGSCDGEHFVAGEPTELSESTIKALGSDVTVTGEVKANPAPAQSTPVQPTQEVKKEVSQPQVEKPATETK